MKMYQIKLKTFVSVMPHFYIRHFLLQKRIFAHVFFADIYSISGSFQDHFRIISEIKMIMIYRFVFSRTIIFFHTLALILDNLLFCSFYSDGCLLSF